MKNLLMKKTRFGAVTEYPRLMQRDLLRMYVFIKRYYVKYLRVRESIDLILV